MNTHQFFVGDEESKLQKIRRFLLYKSHSRIIFASLHNNAHCWWVYLDFLFCAFPKSKPDRDWLVLTQSFNSFLICQIQFTKGYENLLDFIFFFPLTYFSDDLGMQRFSDHYTHIAVKEDYVSQRNLQYCEQTVLKYILCTRWTKKV